VVSFPKCGRTWLAFMIGSAICKERGIATEDPTDIQRLYRLTSLAPNLVFTHDGGAFGISQKAPDEVRFDTRRYRGHRVVFLARDPRDVMVSLFFQAQHRSPGMVRHATPDDMVHAARGGLPTIIEFFKVWLQNSHLPGRFLLVTYEEMQRDAYDALVRVADLLGLRLSESSIRHGVQAGRFSNMREVERQAVSYRLAPGDPGNQDSYKTRRGVVGGYVDYLSPQAMLEASTMLQRELGNLLPQYDFRLDRARESEER
jgi:hypothetical protein